jgi:hypothetical protein
MKRAKILGLALALAMVMGSLAGCLTPKGKYVVNATPRGPYIDAMLATDSGDWRFFFPPTETCAAMLKPESPVTYALGGQFGHVTAADGSRCDAVGVASLREWRARRGRVAGEMVASAHANWRIVHRDPEVILLRGTFPTASRLWITNTFDIVVMVPNDDTCRPIAEGGAALLRFHQTGSRVLRLGNCSVTGVATPLGPSAGSP